MVSGSIPTVRRWMVHQYCCRRGKNLRLDNTISQIIFLPCVKSNFKNDIAEIQPFFFNHPRLSFMSAFFWGRKGLISASHSKLFFNKKVPKYLFTHVWRLLGAVRRVTRLDSLYQWFFEIILNRPRSNHCGIRWSLEVSLRLDSE